MSGSPSGPAHLRGGALQQHGIQGDGGEHAGLAGAGLGLHDQICKERPRRSGQPRDSPGSRPRPARSPSPQRPSGMAFSCTGDGRWKPAASSPASTGGDSSREPKSEGPPGSSTSRVRNRPAASTGAAILAGRAGESRESCRDPVRGERRQGAPCRAHGGGCASGRAGSGHGSDGLGMAGSVQRGNSPKSPLSAAPGPAQTPQTPPCARQCCPNAP